MSTNKMDPKVRAKWVEALRSGEYEQGRGALRRDGGRFCCLGVLTDLAVKEGEPHLQWDEETDAARWRSSAWSGDAFDQADYYALPTDQADYYVLPTPVVVWAGLRDSDPRVRPSRDDLRNDLREYEVEDYVIDGIMADVEANGSVGLSVLNDSQISFGVIANIIEEHL